MSGFKGTPGPWFVTGSMTKYIEARINGGLIQEVAACGPTDADGGYGDQQQANANLIAAAPDLLEALMSARKELEMYEGELTGEVYNNPAINAAINKALGVSDE